MVDRLHSKGFLKTIKKKILDYLWGPKLHPRDGGCWYCHRTKNLAFCCEFDCYVHIGCIELALAVDPNDQEASIMFYELRHLSKGWWM